MNTFKLELSVVFFSIGLVITANRVALADLVGHWKFDGDLTDSIGGSDGSALGDAAAGTSNGIVGGAVTFDGDINGQTVLIAGGAGAVGHHAIQIAKYKGARVLSTVSSAEKADYVRGAGADEAINYRTEDVAARVRLAAVVFCREDESDRVVVG